MATCAIVSRTISSVVDQRFQDGGCEASRALDVSSNWTKIRIGLRLATDAAANITGSPVIAFGLCAGKLDGFGRTTTAHFAGCRMSGTQFTFTSGSPNYVTANTAGGILACKRVGSTTTDGSAVSTVAPVIVAAPTTNRSAFFLEVTKGSPNFTFQFGAPTTAAAGQTDISFAKFQEAMDWPAWSVNDIANWLAGYSKGSAITLAVSEGTNGTLDAVNVYWNQTSTLLEFSGIQVSKLA